MKRLFVTGLSGFVGQAILQALQDKQSMPDVQLVGPSREIHLSDQSGLASALTHARPDHVIHLAAQSYVPQAFANPRETFETNFLGTLNLLQALKAADFHGRMLFVGSGDEYGLVENSCLPVTEIMPLRPRNPYSVSKVAAEALCYQWSQTEQIDIVMARPFNHIGPGQSERFVVSGFARQAMEIKLGLREPCIAVGDIDVTRDFTDVRDIVRAYFGLLEHAQTGEAYNVCSGTERRLSDILAVLLDTAKVEAEIMRDEQRLRLAEQRRMVGANGKLTDCCGWIPAISLEQSLSDIADDWEKRLTNE